jgi:multiple sugar transport system permease protein
MTSSSSTNPAIGPAGASRRLRAESAPARAAKRWLQRYGGIGFVGPAVVIVVIVLLGPIADDIRRSLHSGSLISSNPNRYVGTQHYSDLLGDPAFRSTIVRTLLITGLTTLIAMLAGVAWAVALDRDDVPARGFMQTLIIVPWALSGVVAGRIWSILIDPNFGYVNWQVSQHVLHPLGLSQGRVIWPSSGLDSTLAVSLTASWRVFPVVYVMVLAALQSVPRELIEAATVDGAGFAQRLRHIVLPAIMPAVLVVAALVFISTANDFSTILVMTGGGPVDATRVLPLDAYRSITDGLAFGEAATISVITAAMLAIVGAIFLVALRRRERAA